jgi:hypothetical protein
MKRFYIYCIIYAIFVVIEVFVKWLEIKLKLNIDIYLWKINWSTLSVSYL